MKMAALILSAAAVAGCQAPPSRAEERRIDYAYMRGAADAVKRLYWARQALEAPPAARPAGKQEYYTWEESGAALDGRKLAPETVAVPVFVPAPAPADGP